MYLPFISTCSVLCEHNKRIIGDKIRSINDTFRSIEKWNNFLNFEHNILRPTEFPLYTSVSRMGTNLEYSTKTAEKGGG